MRSLSICPESTRIFVSMALGERIASLRKERGWTQAQLAERLEMSPSHLSRWEQNHWKPRQKSIEQLAEVFEVDVEELVVDDEDVPAKLAEDDPELANLVARIPELNSQQKDALRLVLQSMLTCKQLEHLVAQNR